MADRADNNVFGNLIDLGVERERKSSRNDGGNGGGGSMDDVIRRVSALEKGQELVISKLDGIAKGIADGRLENEKRFGAIEGRLTGLEAKLDTKASSEALAKVGGELGGRLQGVEGKVSNIPDVRATITLTLTTIALCLGGVSAIAFTLFKIFGHAP